MLAKPGPQQRTLDVFLPKLSRDEWMKEQELRRAEVKKNPNASVEVVPTPSVRVVPVKRGPGRPRKPRQLVVDLTTQDIINSSQGTKGTGETKGTDGTDGTGGTNGTGNSSGTALKLSQDPSPPKTRRDWLHPTLFLRMYM